jgi:hypothetical protein
MSQSTKINSNGKMQQQSSSQWAQVIGQLFDKLKDKD